MQIFLIYFCKRKVMNKSMDSVENNCGVAPEGISYFDPGNNPNFVFANDPAFETITLYDIEGNVANVNSWFECAHYVNGGWSSAQIVNFQGDKFLFFSILIIAAVTSIFYFMNVNKNNVEK